MEQLPYELIFEILAQTQSLKQMANLGMCNKYFYSILKSYLFFGICKKFFLRRYLLCDAFSLLLNTFDTLEHIKLYICIFNDKIRKKRIIKKTVKHKLCNLNLVKWIINKFLLSEKEIEIYIFYTACKSGNFEIVKWVVDNFPEMYSELRYTDAFKNALKSGNIGVVKLLIQKYPNIDICNLTFGYSSKETLFTMICENYNRELFEWLTDEFKDIAINSLKPEYISEIFNHGNAKHHIQICKYLVKNYTEEINTLINNRTVFCYLYNRKFYCIIEYIIAKNSNTFIIINDKINFPSVSRSRMFAVAKYIIRNTTDDLFEHYSKEYCFGTVCRYGHLRLAKYFVDTFPDTDIHWHNEFAFRYACKNNHIKIVKWLTKKYPTIYVHAKRESAFRKACKTNSFAIIKWLLQNYPKINRNVRNDQAFRRLCKNGDLRLIKWFVQKYPNIDQKTVVRTFQNACIKNKLRVAKYLEQEYQILHHTNLELIFRKTVKNGQSGGTIIWIIEQLSNISNNEINFDILFQYTCKFNIRIPKLLLTKIPDINIHADNDCVFRDACEYNHETLAMWLCMLCASYRIVNISQDRIYFEILN